ncbi:twin-arginine translocation pathway signal [Nocardia fluminea]|uniref:twin-arginine translocation pathway signal n=1 Tax=Nocardia fluminea TaxID=134984 RepID=UPI0033C255AE
MNTEELTPDTDEETESPSTPTASDSSPRRGHSRLVIAVVLAVTAATAWTYLFFAVRAEDRALAPDRQQAAVDAAADATVAILTYQADTVDTDLAAAHKFLTGTFADYYRTFTRDVVAPAAKEKKISTTATVTGKGIAEFGEKRAVAVVFVNQQTMLAPHPEPTPTTTTVRVELERHGDHWLVSKFDPA